MFLKLTAILMVATPTFSLIGPMTKQNGDVDQISIINHVTLMEQVITGLENTMKATSTELTTVKANLKTTREEFLSLQSQHNTAVKDLAVTGQQLKDALIDIVALKSDLKSAHSEIVSLKSKIVEPSVLTVLKTDISQLQRDVTEFGDNLNTTQTDLFSIKTDVGILQSRQINATIIDIIGSDVKSNSKQIDLLQAELQQVKSEVNETSNDLNGTRQEVMDICTLVNMTSEEVSNLTDTVNDLHSSLNGTRYNVNNIGMLQNVTSEEIRRQALDMSIFTLELNNTRKELSDVNASTYNLLAFVSELNISVSNMSVLVDHLETDIAFQASPSAYFFDAKDTEKLVYDSVHYNEGNAFNATSSEFVAPVSGTYMFWAGASTFGPNTNVKIRLNVNHSRNGYLAQGTGIASNNASESTASVLTVAHLQPGDVIWAEKYQGTDRLFGSEESYFGGVLLRRH